MGGRVRFTPRAAKGEMELRRGDAHLMAERKLAAPPPVISDERDDTWRTRGGWAGLPGRTDTAPSVPAAHPRAPGGPDTVGNEAERP